MGTMMSGTFPQYRRLIGKDHLYRIDGVDRFVELQRIGARWVRHEVTAHAYPEMVRIMEMLSMKDRPYIKLDPDEWKKAEEQLPKH